MKRVQDKVAIVTGAASGIGKATATMLALHGAKVVLTDRESGVKELAGELREAGLEAIATLQDVSSEEDWQNVIETAIRYYGRIDILVNNAGTGSPQNVTETPAEKWDQVLAVNTRSVFLGMKYAAPEMKKVGGGSIINMSSIYTLIGTGGSAAYHASKGAIRGLTKTAAIEFAKDRIRVNTIHPGVIETPMTQKKLSDKEIRAKHQEMTPWPEFGKPEDIAYGALYLASDESAFVTGAELVIDGGYTAM